MSGAAKNMSGEQEANAATMALRNSTKEKMMGGESLWRVTGMSHPEISEYLPLIQGSGFSVSSSSSAVFRSGKDEYVGARDAGDVYFADVWMENDNAMMGIRQDATVRVQINYRCEQLIKLSYKGLRAVEATGAVYGGFLKGVKGRMESRSASIAVAQQVER